MDFTVKTTYRISTAATGGDFLTRGSNNAVGVSYYAQWLSIDYGDGSVLDGAVRAEAATDSSPFHGEVWVGGRPKKPRRRVGYALRGADIPPPRS